MGLFKTYFHLIFFVFQSERCPRGGVCDSDSSGNLDGGTFGVVSL